MDSNIENNEVIETKEEVKTLDLKSIDKKELAGELGLVLPKNMSDYVTNTMTEYMERGLILPADYNVQNAVVSSWLMIKQDTKLNTCTKDSISSALVDMATMGLNATKKQCYFIPRDGKLHLDPSYFGKITAIKRIKGVIDVRSDVIYKSTEYELINDEYGNDDITIKKPCPLEERNFENIVGVWCRIILEEKVWGSHSFVCLMTMDQVRKSWNQGAMKGQSPAHKNFTDEMAKKSVINRCCKQFVNSAKDNDILIETINRVMGDEYLDYDESSKKVIESKVIDFD